MQNTLRFSVRFLAVASAALGAAMFTTQAARAATALNVPFAFTVGGKVCPAGRYMVRTDDLGGSVELLGQARGFKWVIHPGDPAPTDNRVVLKFDSIGSQHVLRSVQFGPMTTSRLDKRIKESEVATQGGTAVEAGE